MQFDWTTFALEIVDFLVLVWILQRFLYRPVTDVIARRAAEVEHRLSGAQTARAEAQALKLQYEGLATDSGRDREVARTKLHEEIAIKRTRLLEGLDASLEEEREKRRATERQRTGELRQQARDEALTAAGIFMARLFSRLSSAELEAGICQVVVEDLDHLAEPDAQAIRTASQVANAKARVTSAFALSQTQRETLTETLIRVAGRPVACEFGEDTQLMAGLRITLGSWIVRANLNDEMHLFVDSERHVG